MRVAFILALVAYMVCITSLPNGSSMGRMERSPGPNSMAFSSSKTLLDSRSLRSSTLILPMRTGSWRIATYRSCAISFDEVVEPSAYVKSLSGTTAPLPSPSLRCYVTRFWISGPESSQSISSTERVRI